VKSTDVGVYSLMGLGLVCSCLVLCEMKQGHGKEC